MERAVWVCACALALSLAAGISSMSSATASQSAKINSKSLEITTCKAKSSCGEPIIKPLGRTSEMFLRKVKRVSRKAFA